ncbi:MAG TPA: tRNA pseudouridine(55) synthase TruB [Herpetosiphon sp.]|uniref:tRNA pseudouridine synthase B n=1 Tax=Herpetosiphon aurantiacus (strain ATCC 23779 / DSM 785 / 114-95) TaxID=316274 RepID=A9AV52_HERA2|nr:tRNA pseudouridine(55) synthase TruB [Herpetosiphon sp.]ABX03130.1 tRNA pseudouridine synthase B [Herpetosiphon aurantiacus DSM 785]HBW50769.1 tRNA pseudouridine(55) synthase TruB [Herpetosiphon sp.]
MLHGFLNIDKPQGITSTDVVRVVKRNARQKRVGHGGTLDPMATGVLPIALGNATRLLEYLLEEERKAYTATLRLGITTDSDDVEGAVIAEAPIPPLDPALIESVLSQFRGAINQVPPQYAAIRVDGKRMYEYAREGKHIELPARPITIEQLDLLAWDAQQLTIAVDCSKGTYIRAIARDIGALLGCGAHLTALRRTRAGAFDLSNSIGLAELDQQPEVFAAALLPPQAAIANWPLINLADAIVADVRMGRVVQVDSQAERVGLLDQAGQLVAIAVLREAGYQPIKVFAAEE